MYTKIRPHIATDEAPLTLDYLSFKNNMTDPPVHPVAGVPFVTLRNHLWVTSTSRDRSLHPNPASFGIKLPTTYKNIIAIELIGGVIPNLDNIANDAYLFLDIPNLNHILTTDNFSYFAILGLNHHQNVNFLNLDKTNTEGVPITFESAKERLDHISLTLRHPDGSEVTFGNEDPSTPSDLALQASFLFEIRTKIPTENIQKISPQYQTY
jgi:hypothetical protein